MLTETQVVDAVCKYLREKEFNIKQCLDLMEKGDDIIAEHHGKQIRLFIEAKGETSVNSKTSNFGKPFTSSQVRTHISVGLYKCAEVLTNYDKNDSVYAALALPNNEQHRTALERIEIVFPKLRIPVFLVNQGGSVLLHNDLSGENDIYKHLKLLK
ncbi:hypothetical protein [Brevibacillus agri]|uniref:hypothetical protein n=1 Tax=Brevibacillus agri TaxID=51101 RepID=UPI003D209C70